jgi:hypothetical protein
MSDMSQGPGWWIASDGKWYPPHLHPSVRTPDPSEAVDSGASGQASDAAVSGAFETPADVSPGVASAFPSSSPASSFTPAYGAPGAGGYGTETGLPESLAPKKRSRGPLAVMVSIVVVILLVVGAVVIFGNSESASAEVINAVNSTLSNGTAHVTMNISGQAVGTNVSGTGSGSIDFTNNALELQMSIEADGQQVPVTAIYLGGMVYETIPGLSTITPGKSWVSIDLSALQNATKANPSSQGLGNDPGVMLQMLARQGNTVVPLGPSTVGGVAVNGYSVTVNPASIEQQIKNANLPSWMQQAVKSLKVHDIAMKVYVDNAGLLRSFEVQTSESSGAAGTVSIDETLDFSDYGTSVSVTAPPAGQVESFQQLEQAAATQGGTTS